jgi:hypothetical protein
MMDMVNMLWITTMAKTIKATIELLLDYIFLSFFNFDYFVIKAIIHRITSPILSQTTRRTSNLILNLILSPILSLISSLISCLRLSLLSI